MSLSSWLRFWRSALTRTPRHRMRRYPAISRSSRRYTRPALMELEPRFLLSGSSLGQVSVSYPDGQSFSDNGTSGASISAVIKDDANIYAPSVRLATGSAFAGNLAPSPGTPNAVTRIEFNASFSNPANGDGWKDRWALTYNRPQ